MKNKVRNPVVHFEVLGRDASVLRKFYSEAFGWQLGPADDSPLEYSMVHQKEQGSGIDGGIGKAPQGPGRNLGIPPAKFQPLERRRSLAMQGSLLYSTAGADRWARHAASQRRHRVLRAGDAEGGAALRRRGD